MPRLPWTKKYKLLPSSKKWTIGTNVSFFFDVFSMLALIKHAHWLKKIGKKKQKKKTRSRKVMILAFGTHQTTKKKKNWCRHQTQENERGSESVIRCYLCLGQIE